VSERILVVEDERGIQVALSGLLRREGYEVSLASTGEEALDLLAEGPFDLVLTDLALGRGMSGMDVLKASRAHRAETAVVMITAHGTEKIAVQAMKSGADDYVPKPFDNDELRLVIRRALDRTKLARDHRLLLERVEREYGFGALIGSGPAMQRVFDTIRKVAETDLTVLIQGESGTGKELVAQALHGRSARADRPFIAVNCAAITDELVESELFGHEKGAFTGAHARRIGRFEAADGGTIFLDEIGDMPQLTQAKILRVLQEQTFERVGGSESLRVDVRVVAATHRDLQAQIEAGKFRQDLFFRLQVVPLELPPLRERLDDLPALADRFLEQLAHRLKRSRKRLDDQALARLSRHSWPGNVRELRNAVERAAVLAEDEVIRADEFVLRGAAPGLDHSAGTGASFADAKRSVIEQFERSFLQEALSRNEGNISQTAKDIGMARQSLQQKLKELDLRWERRPGRT